MIPYVRSAPMDVARKVAIRLATNAGVPPPNRSTPCPHSGCSWSHKLGACLCGYKKLGRLP